MKTITIDQGIDEVGEPQSFTWDVFPVVDLAKTKHLDENGLPPIGTVIRPGMVVVGKIGKSKSYDPADQPSRSEILLMTPGELRSKWGHMWIDGSYYAGPDDSGTVIKAYFSQDGNHVRATIIVE